MTHNNLYDAYGIRSKNVPGRPLLEELFELKPKKALDFVPKFIDAGRHEDAKELSDYLVNEGISRTDISRRSYNALFRLCCRDREGARKVASKFRDYGWDIWYESFIGNKKEDFKSKKDERVAC